MVVQRVRRFARQHSLFRPETRVVVALSGGSDSVALACVLRALHISGDLQLVAAAHFNHQLRELADRDEQFSASVARALDVPFLSDRENIRTRARRERRSLEDAARRGRYEFFERARRRFDADVIALGHTRDDQAETFLLRLLRGAGPRGLAGMYPRSGRVIRPVLDCRRLELRAFLDQRKITFVEDESNADVAIARNRIRAELLPLLAARFNPAIVDVLAREAELARETWAWLEAAVEKGDGSHFPARQQPENAFGSDGKMTPVPFFLDVPALEAAPPPLRRLAVWRAMTEAADGRPISFGHVQAALRLLDVNRGRVDAPGHRVERLGSRLVLTCRQPELSRSVFQYQLSIPGEVALLEAGCSLVAEPGMAPVEASDPSRSGRGPMAMVRGDLCPGPLAVRNRRPGDRFRPVGMGGRKKLQDYFVDRKVAAAARDRVPLVVDQTDRIIWVAGYGIDEAFRVTDGSQSVLFLRLKQA